MNFHINDFDAPPALEDDFLRECELHKVIDRVCTEPGCPNNPRAHAKNVVEGKIAGTVAPAPIYRTDTKTRCIL